MKHPTGEFELLHDSDSDTTTPRRDEQDPRDPEIDDSLPLCVCGNPFCGGCRDYDDADKEML